MFVPEPSHMPEKQNNAIKHEEINTNDPTNISKIAKNAIKHEDFDQMCPRTDTTTYMPERMKNIIKHKEKWEIATDIQPQILHWNSFLI